MEYTRNITRRANRVVRWMENEFFAYSDREIRAALRELEEADDSNWYDRLGVLMHMLKDCGCSIEKGKMDEFERIRTDVEKILSTGRIPDRDTICDKISGIGRQFCLHYQDFPTPADFMRRLVEDLCKPKDPWQNDSVRMRILKQFIKYGNCLKGVKNVGNASVIKDYMKQKLGVDTITDSEMLLHLNDGTLEEDIFDLRGDKYRLMRIADALASGVFFTNGATKRNLYLFAIVFEMTFYSYNKADGVRDEVRDIETRLFTDYYAMNLLRYLSGAHQTGAGEAELDPVCSSINYKNYEEMIFLYYIRQELTPQEKLKGALRMSGEVKKAAQEQKLAALPHTDDMTQKMRVCIRGEEGKDAEDILALDAEAFKAFLLKKYDFNLKAKNTSALMIQTDSHTAQKRLNEIRKELLQYCSNEEYKKLYGGDLWRSMQEEINRMKKKESTETENYAHEQSLTLLRNAEMNYGLSFEEFWRSRKDREQLEKDPSWAAFFKLMTYTDDALKNWYKDDGKPVNRTRLLAALYYRFNKENADTHNMIGYGFARHFEEFCKMADPELDKCNFAPVSSKNLMDLLVVTSSYIYINQ